MLRTKVVNASKIDPTLVPTYEGNRAFFEDGHWVLFSKDGDTLKVKSFFIDHRDSDEEDIVEVPVPFYAGHEKFEAFAIELMIMVALDKGCKILKVGRDTFRLTTDEKDTIKQDRINACKTVAKVAGAAAVVIGACVLLSRD